MKERYYFDYNATTPLSDEVRQEMVSRLGQDMKNPSSSHADGRLCSKEIEKARFLLARLVDCEPDEIIFTSGATEANNLALFGLWESRPHEKLDTIVTTTVEHDCVLRPLTRLQSRGARVTKVPVNNVGELNLAEFQNSLTGQVLFASVMLANNETGIIFPVAELAQLAHQKGALLHVDAACGMGKIPFSFKESGADLVSLSAHKFYGPKGIGALIIKKGIFLTPQILGGTHEMGRRAGTENVVSVFGLAKALEFALDRMDAENTRLLGLRKELLAGLRQLDSEVVVIENVKNQLSGTVSVAFPQITGQLLLTSLDLEGVSVSHGSACHSGSLSASRVLLEMGINKSVAEGAIRISFGRMTTKKDIAGILEIFDRVLKRLRKK